MSEYVVGFVSRFYKLYRLIALEILLLRFYVIWDTEFEVPCFEFWTYFLCVSRYTCSFRNYLFFGSIKYIVLEIFVLRFYYIVPDILI